MQRDNLLWNLRRFAAETYFASIDCFRHILMMMDIGVNTCWGSCSIVALPSEQFASDTGPQHKQLLANPQPCLRLVHLINAIFDRFAPSLRQCATIRLNNVGPTLGGTTMANARVTDIALQCC